jgi:hypothetical protein
MLKHIIFFAFILALTPLMAQGPYSISGRVATQAGEGVGNFSVVLRDGSGNTIMSQEVDCDGNYTLAGLEADTPYSLFLDKPDPDFVINGVSTFDLVLISKHLLDVQPFNNPYSVAAADVDGSGVITVKDMVLIRAAIYALITQWPSSNWVFFRDGEQAATYPFTLTGDLTGIDFIGVKRGDVNGSAFPCN